MLKRVIFALFAEVLFCCVLSLPAHGQAQPCTFVGYCTWYSFNSGCQPTPPKNAFNLQSIPWSSYMVYSYLVPGCPPPPPPCGCGIPSGAAGGAPTGGSRVGGHPIASLPISLEDG